ncbi:hypothetical protein IAT38_005824 [Cryptococcus sp. DSM 104549]
MADDIKVHEQREMYGPWPRWWRINAFKYARWRAEAEGREVLQQQGFERYELVWGRCALGWETDVGQAKKELWRPRIPRWWHSIVDEQVEADRKKRQEAQSVSEEIDEGYTTASSGSEGKHSTDRLLPESKETVAPVSNTCPKEDKCFCCYHI